MSDQVVTETQEPQPPVESEIDLLKKELDQVRAQSQEYLDGWQRARAELANARKRFEKERAEAGQYAIAELARKLLPVSDDFERALANIPDETRNQPWLEGINLIYRKLQTAFESSGIAPIGVQPGDVFDPAIHEAITHEESAERQSGEIIAETQKGYKMGESVLRPALVRVAK